MEKTISMATLAKRAEAIAEDIESTGTVYRIKLPGRQGMLLVNDQYLERWKATYEFMAQHPNWERELAEARQEYRAGKYIPLEVVLQDLGLDGARHQTKRRAPARRATRDRQRKSR